MKFFVASCLIVATVAELPRYRPARFRLQRQELAPTTTEAAPESTTAGDAPYPPASAPYPPSGWKPAGQAFTLPEKSAPTDTYGAPQQNAPYPPSGWKPQGPEFKLPEKQQVPPPSTSYGVPDNSYGPPDNSYGPPDNTYGAPSTTDATEAVPTENPQAEKLEGPVEVQKSVGTYYVVLPNGELQRVEFMTENDVQNMAYTARLQVRDRAPLFLLRV